MSSAAAGARLEDMTATQQHPATTGVTFRATVELDGRTATGIVVPAESARRSRATRTRDVPPARAAFDALSYSRRRAHVLSVEGAETAATRERRVAKAVAELAGDGIAAAT